MLIIKRAVIKLGIIILNIIYLPLKLFKTKNKITYISRQSDKPSIDFELLYKKVKKMDYTVEQVVLTKKMGKGIKKTFKYLLHMLVQMYHIATSKVVVVDTYIIAVSVLKHKKSLKVIQIWHALGAIKQFGYQVIDKKEGSSRLIAESMKMHKNYDVVTTSSSVTAEFYSEAFNISKDKVKVIGMPRVDYILKANKDARILKFNPKYKDKKTILYIPTFRKKENLKLEELIKNVDDKKYNLIIRKHPLDGTKVPAKYVAKGDFTTYELMHFADYIITDYSATAIEASLLNKPIYLYVYDIDNYEDARGLNVKLTEELKASTYKDIKDILEKIYKEEYNYDELIAFRNKYIETHSIDNTKSVCDLIFTFLNEKKSSKQS